MTHQELSLLNNYQLVDVRLPDDFEAAHLTGAKNNCVFEIPFNDRLTEAAPDKSATTVVYGANASSLEAETAREKLQRAGYADVRILEGGIEVAKEAGLTITQGKPLPLAPTASEGTHDIDLEESRVEWLGRNLLNKHVGTIPFESGQLQFENGNLVGGEFKIDLRKIECADLAGTDLHDVLISHLKSDDFFDVANYPTAHFVITNASTVVDSTPGAPNLAVEGNLTLRGRTEPIQFLATVGLAPTGQPSAQSTITIDRTRWGVLYGSGKLFHRLAGHLVNDMIEIQLRILTH